MDMCTDDICDSMTGVITHPVTDCDDGYACTMNSCDVALGCVATGPDFYFEEGFSDNSAGWTLDTDWEIGPAVANCGDPATDTSPSDDNGVAGVVIGDCAPTAQHDYYYLTSPPIDTTAAMGSLFVNFQRDLWSDYTPYMKNIVEVFDGMGWVTIWETFGNPGVNDSEWQGLSYDITPYSNDALQVRFGFNIASGGVFNRGSWNVDDVTLTSEACP